MPSVRLTAKLLQEVADRGPVVRLAQSGAPRSYGAEEDYTKFVRPEYELGCDVGEKRSREFWQRRFGVSPD